MSIEHLTDFETGTMRLIVLSLVVAVVAGCAATPPRVTGIEISRIGIINHLPTVGKDVYFGATVFNNKSEDVIVDWNFPGAVHAELTRRLVVRSVEVVDLSGAFAVPAENLFETGYSLKFGLSKHVVSERAVTELSRLVTEENLDAVVVLRAARWNVDTPYGKREPIGAFGFYRYYGGLFWEDPQHTFLQIVARVISGDSPTVVEDLHASNLVKDEGEEDSKFLSNIELKERFLRQISKAVLLVVDGLNL